MLDTMSDTSRQGGQRQQWLDNITQWAEKGLVDTVRLAEDRNGYRRFVFGAAYIRSFTGNGKLGLVQYMLLCCPANTVLTVYILFCLNLLANKMMVTMMILL